MKTHLGTSKNIRQIQPVLRLSIAVGNEMAETPCLSGAMPSGKLKNRPERAVIMAEFLQFHGANL